MTHQPAIDLTAAEFVAEHPGLCPTTSEDLSHVCEMSPEMRRLDREIRAQQNATKKIAAE